MSLQIDGAPAAQAENPPGFIPQDQIDAAVAQAEADAKAKADGKPAEEAPADDKPTKPDTVPDKFWDAEKGQVNTDALLKSYQELEQKQSQQPKPDDKPAEDKPEDGEVQDALKAAGFEYRALATEFTENGDFTPDTVEKLEKAFGKELVDDYREAKKAQFAGAAGAFDAAVYAAVDGQDNFTAANEWARTALTPKEIAEFNDHVTSGDVTRATLAAKNLQARFTAEGGKGPSLVTGGKTGQNAVGGYASVEQIGEAMNDPRYRSDSAYRREVDAKIDRSTHLLRG